MIKINPFNLSRPVETAETKSFVDPLHPEAPLELTLRTLDSAETCHAMEVGETEAVRFLGAPEVGVIPERAPLFIDGKAIQISRMLCRNVAIIEAMQVAKDENERYTFDQLLGITVTLPSAWREVVAWSNKIGKAEPKNA